MQALFRLSGPGPGMTYSRRVFCISKLLQTLSKPHKTTQALHASFAVQHAATDDG